MISTILEYLSFPISALAILGAYLVSNVNVQGYYAWIITNIFFISFNAYHGHYGLMSLYICYLGIVFNGIYNFKRV